VIHNTPASAVATEGSSSTATRPASPPALSNLADIPEPPPVALTSRPAGQSHAPQDDISQKTPVSGQSVGTPSSSRRSTISRHSVVLSDPKLLTPSRRAAAPRAVTLQTPSRRVSTPSKRRHIEAFPLAPATPEIQDSPRAAGPCL
jgi:hypothetical protein